MTPSALHSLITQGEPKTLEFKRSTAELRRADKTLCAFLNGKGGQVLISVGPDGKIVEQLVPDITLRDVAVMFSAYLNLAKKRATRESH